MALRSRKSNLTTTRSSGCIEVGDTLLFEGWWWLVGAVLRDPSSGLLALYLVRECGCERVVWESEVLVDAN